MRCHTLCVAACAAACSGLSLTVDDGVLTLPNGKRKTVGRTSSALQNVIDTYLAPSPPPAAVGPVINSSALNYLRVVGKYTADAQLRPPAYTIVLLDGAALNATPACTDAVVMLTNTYAGVATGPGGGVIDCAGWSGDGRFRGVYALNVAHAYVQGITVANCGQGGSGGIHVEGGHDTEVSGVEVYGSGNRGVWLETGSRFVVHHSFLHHNSADGIDIDAYTKTAIVFSNICDSNKRHGIFIEQCASGASLFNNTCTNNTAGICLYNNLCKVPLTDHIMVANRLLHNHGQGLSLGSNNHNGDGDVHANYFVSNVIRGNGGGGWGINGAADGNVALSNDDGDGLTSRIAAVPTGAIAFFDPLDTERLAA